MSYNVWAFESKNSTYNTALANAKKQYRSLKIFNGPFGVFCTIFPIKFDIVYLDFTSSLLDTSGVVFSTIHDLFDTGILSTLGCVAVNTTVPDMSEENIEFLASYFLHQPFVEGTIYGMKKGKKPVHWMIEGPRGTC